MSLNRNQFYLFLSLACLVGYLWLALVGRLKPEEIGSSYDVCLIRHFLHIPCPSCGSTRSVLALIHGDFEGGLYWNPLGFLILSVLIICPFWIGFDLVQKKDTLFAFFRLFENTLRHKWVAIPAIALLLLNWIWNILKGV
ncbi:MAG: DUF2752 domain-containing protein [Prolixibacteraceae bacterium]